MSRDVKYIGMDVHKEAIVIAVLNGSGKLVMETIVETKASSIVQFIHGLRGELHVTWEEGTWAAWLYDRMSSKGWRVQWRQTHRGKSQTPVAWIAGRRETESLKPIDKAILGMVSESPGRNESERIGGLENGSPRGRALDRRAKAAWTVAN